uniref:NADH dehydrogenase subunit 5 n=1 Tax=Pilargis verrucosa TaxID=1818081 RepID=UPI0030E4B8AC
MPLKFCCKSLSKYIWCLMMIMFIPALWITMKKKIILIEWTIFSINSTEFLLPLILDPLGMLFSITVLFISANVLSFSSTYMKGDMFIQRFIHLVLLFILSMNMLIFIPHLMALLLGWDGLGITSFILVIYYQNPKSLAAGMITALMNRIGDVMLLLAMAWSLNQGHWTLTNMWQTPFAQAMTISILIAGMTKSAQMPFSSWLPAAMAAPTPVSALVHSSTLVTAGVFLLIRFYPFLHKIVWFNKTLLIIATMTMFMAGLSAIAECDMKKIIALSTLSQLGVMMMSLGLNLPLLTFFHLITHALFKALLFLCAGAMIHLHHHSQDLRTMGNTSKQMPLTTSCLLIANMALCGNPFLAGFYSKDMIIEFSLYNPSNSLIIMLLLVATSLTAAYSTRLLLTSLWGPSLSLPIQYINDEYSNMTNPMMLLTTGAIIGGATMNWIMISPNLEPCLTLNYKTMTLMITMVGIITAYITTTKNYSSKLIMLPMTHHSTTLMWFLVPLMSQNIIKSPMNLSHLMLKSLDHGWVELCSAGGMQNTTSNLSKKIQAWQTNLITPQLSLMLILLALPLMHLM